MPPAIHSDEDIQHLVEVVLLLQVIGHHGIAVDQLRKAKRVRAGNRVVVDAGLAERLFMVKRVGTEGQDVGEREPVVRAGLVVCAYLIVALEPEFVHLLVRRGVLVAMEQAQAQPPAHPRRRVVPAKARDLLGVRAP